MDFLFYDILICIIFFIAVIIFLKKNKKNVSKEGVFFLYRSKFGIKKIDYLVKKYPKFFHFIEKINITVGFVGMAVILYLLAMSSYKIAAMTQVIKTPPLVPLLPWISFPGMPTLYFTIWIIMISIIAVVHEGAHGIFSRLNKIKLKSTGFGFLGPIVIAFVEPDEKQLVKKSPKVQLSVFSAGPAANFMLAGIFFIIISLAINPIYTSAMQDVNLKAASIVPNSSAYIAGIEKKDIITIKDIEKTSNVEMYIRNITVFFIELKPNQTVNIKIENKNKDVSLITSVNPKNESKGYTGIEEIEIIPKFSGIAKIMPFISALFFWIFIANLFVGLFNLLPFWVVDGGRMFYAAAFAITKSKKNAMKKMKTATAFTLFLIFLMFLVWAVRMLFG